MPSLSILLQALFEQRKLLIYKIIEKKEYIKKLEKEIISLKQSK